ncbi:MAG: hypothetical protein NT154_15280, partial [Verrucomicrobia bacterium]|nr:hypothetical protein [Verrucomicrobiota bacterium]
MIATLTKPSPSRRHAVKPRPLMPISAVQWRLDLSENEVVALIEEGELLFAFDIREPKAVRTAPRVLTQSVQDFLSGHCSSADDEETEWQNVAKMIFPDRPTIVTCELARLLNCGRQHAMNLLYARQFKVAPGSRIRRGPGGSAWIETA